MARKAIKRSGPPRFPEHPEEEHDWRLQRARKIMEEDGLDALLLGRNVNVFYATGSRFVFVGMDAPVALAPQSVAIITKDADIYCQRFGPFDSDEVPEHTTWSGSLEMYDDELEILNILSDYAISEGARIGTEWGPGNCVGINPLKFQVLQDELLKKLRAEVVDAASTVSKIMSVKSNVEIERMTKAVKAAARAMERVYDVIKIGMSEVELAQMTSRFMMEEGADALSHAQVMAEGDGQMRFLSCNALDRPIEKGWVHLDLGCRYRRYMSDINRGVFLGRQPTAEEERLYACRLGVSELMDKLIRPGLAIDDLLEEVDRYIERQGYRLRKIGGAAFVGHSLGLEPYQKPNLIPSEFQPEFTSSTGKVLLEPGMVFTYEMAIETPVEMPFFNIEDNVVVTDSGVENMNAELSRELRVIA
jgi:Xaa-Pro aminopeptidase